MAVGRPLSSRSARRRSKAPSRATLTLTWRPSKETPRSAILASAPAAGANAKKAGMKRNSSASIARLGARIGQGQCSKRRPEGTRRAEHDYEVLERFEAGIELSGTEVKSVRTGKVQLKDSYVDFRNGQAFL